MVCWPQLVNKSFRSIPEWRHFHQRDAGGDFHVVPYGHFVSSKIMNCISGFCSQDPLLGDMLQYTLGYSRWRCLITLKACSLLHRRKRDKLYAIVYKSVKIEERQQWGSGHINFISKAFIQGQDSKNSILALAVCDMPLEKEAKYAYKCCFSLCPIPLRPHGL